MRAEERRDKIRGEVHSRADLEALDRFLMSDRVPEESMLLSDLDGFLTGIAIGPELVKPSEWLPLVFGGDFPAFADPDEGNAILGTIMARYNEILSQVADNDLNPIFWTDPKGTFISADWAQGFYQAITLRADAWTPLFKSKRGAELLFPILALCGDENGESLLGLSTDEEVQAMGEAAELIPGCIAAVAAYWRDPPKPYRTAAKVGRNDPCPCASGKKFKKCCGKAA
jgi:uncharacterized protein